MSSSNAEAQGHSSKKPTLIESVDHLINKKQQERADEGAREVQRQAQGVQEEVSEVMAGVEKPSEEASKRREKKSEPTVKASGKTTSDDQAAALQSGSRGFIIPSEEVMIKKVRAAIQLQIKMEWKRAQRLRENISEGGAQEYNEAISRIRSLTQKLSDLFTATYEYLKEVYIKLFRPDGKRKNMDEIDL